MIVQIQLYFPQFGHLAYGIVRAIAKDSSDYYEGLSSITFLDSDGRVNPIGICHSMPSGWILHWEYLSLS